MIEHAFLSGPGKDLALKVLVKGGG